jgi:hypothetical protein
MEAEFSDERWRLARPQIIDDSEGEQNIFRILIPRALGRLNST